MTTENKLYLKPALNRLLGQPLTLIELHRLADHEAVEDDRKCDYVFI